MNTLPQRLHRRFPIFFPLLLLSLLAFLPRPARAKVCELPESLAPGAVLGIACDTGRVSAGRTARLAAGSIFHFTVPRETNVLLIEGRLLCEGEAERKVVLASGMKRERGGKPVVDSTGWEGLVLQPGGSLQADHLLVSGAKVPLTLWSRNYEVRYLVAPKGLYVSLPDTTLARFPTGWARKEDNQTLIRLSGSLLGKRAPGAAASTADSAGMAAASAKTGAPPGEKPGPAKKRRMGFWPYAATGGLGLAFVGGYFLLSGGSSEDGAERDPQEPRWPPPEPGGPGGASSP